MKNIKFILIIFLLFAINYSCKKFNQSIPDIPEVIETEMSDFIVPDGFKWQTASDYSFVITGGIDEVVRITSEDEKILYHKGTYIEKNGSYDVDLRIPSHINTLKINSVSVYLLGSNISHNLSTKAGIVNNVLSFDGVGDYVNLGDVTDLNSESRFTIEGWANQTDVTANEYIFSKIIDEDNDIRLRTSGGALIVEFGNSGNVYATYSTYGADIGSGNWFHWAIVYNGSGINNAERLKLYINGLPQSFTSFIGVVQTSSANLTGAILRLSSPTLTFTGFMDEFRVWDNARPDGTILQYFDKRIIDPSSSPNLVAYYQMDEGSGIVLGDEKGSYDGTIFGCSWLETSTIALDSDGDTVNDLNDDYWTDPFRAHDNFYPSSSDTGTVVFEDLWPSKGDYDFNDLVIGYNFKTVTSGTNRVTEVYAYFEVRAHGAALNNAFGFQLPDAHMDIESDVVVTGYSHTQGLITIDGTTHFEIEPSHHPIVIVMDQVSDLMGNFQNTETHRPRIPYAPITIKMTVTNDDFEISDFALDTWDPFMIIDQIRGCEVHQIDNPPTGLVNPAYFGTFDDDSDPGNGEYYRTVNGLPWVLEFLTDFEYPTEKSEITRAYLHFREWAESASTPKAYDDWYSNTADPAYRNSTYIY